MVSPNIFFEEIGVITVGVEKRQVIDRTGTYGRKFWGTQSSALREGPI